MIYACGPCAAKLIEAGGVQQDAIIALGTPCGVHPTRVRAAAVAGIEVASSVVRPIATDAPTPAASRAPDPRVTEVATRLLAAWSHGDAGKVDAWLVQRAADVARALVAETEG